MLAHCSVIGHSITLFSSQAAVLDFVDSQTEGSISWVVQRYVDNPVLIPAGRRKFDIRIWVLLDADYNIHVYRRGALRVAAQSYTTSDEHGSELMDLNDIHAHLSMCKHRLPRCSRTATDLLAPRTPDLQPSRTWPA